VNTVLFFLHAAVSAVSLSTIHIYYICRLSTIHIYAVFAVVGSSHHHHHHHHILSCVCARRTRTMSCAGGADTAYVI
jgi:hypothetical protein